jgi:hypothetical protein
MLNQIAGKNQYDYTEYRRFFLAEGHITGLFDESSLCIIMRLEETKGEIIQNGKP